MIYQKVKDYCEKKNITISKFESMCGIGNGTVRLWEDDKNLPRVSTLQKMEKATGIPEKKWIE